MGEGVNFLGFQIRQCKGSGYTLPQKDKVCAFLADIRAWLHANVRANPEAVMPTLTPWLRGGGNYDRHGVRKRRFTYVEHHVWKMRWGWARTRHPHTGKHGIARKYFRPTHAAPWTFHATVETRQGRQKSITRVRLLDSPIQRHIQVEGTASPDDPALDTYGVKRQTPSGRTYGGKDAKLCAVAVHQHWRCPGCGTHLFHGEELQTHHTHPVAKGGTDRVENLVHWHKGCHHQLHQMRKGQAWLEA